ncbi:hypothetical protein EC971742_4991, partial [Escherichia coli 97.1742]
MTKRKTPRHFCPGVCLFLRGAGQLHHAAHATHATHAATLFFPMALILYDFA